jgi:copper homeostasis protein
MIRDIQVAKELGAQGVVFGALQRDGRIDRELCRRLRDEARPLSITFHRAFDLTPEPREAIDFLVELGIDRLLTSGQAASALRGAELIRELVNRTREAICVMPGGGIQAADVVTLVRTTGVREIHASASQPFAPAADDVLGIEQNTRVTSTAAVRSLVAALKEADPS